MFFVINCLPSMTFYRYVVYKFNQDKKIELIIVLLFYFDSTTSRDIPVFDQISLFFNKSLKSPGFENFRLIGLQMTVLNTNVLVSSKTTPIALYRRQRENS